MQQTKVHDILTFRPVIQIPWSLVCLRHIGKTTQTSMSVSASMSVSGLCCYFYTPFPTQTRAFSVYAAVSHSFGLGDRNICSLLAAKWFHCVHQLVASSVSFGVRKLACCGFIKALLWKTAVSWGLKTCFFKVVGGQRILTKVKSCLKDFWSCEQEHLSPPSICKNVSITCDH